MGLKFDPRKITLPNAVYLLRSVQISPQSRDRLKSSRILELGSGLGIAGITAALFSKFTLLTDNNPVVLEALIYNAKLNGLDIIEEESKYLSLINALHLLSP